ncbi:thioredoxin reductase (NADPH) [Salirhabdus euzebyi]|uniref:Ferredoxin--NADP reductase n=1 Tax=Salirhabdus euzebyi TaxID=394506 RepID=A0A841Q108_9BACI|nr:NAD(P)/FAD-dependent oxidoreductase [Salirhabdus euzebyi]MBB6451643.1 thioredoxin reductase (NADPH) [Salirhabdus euzebyi]
MEENIELYDVIIIGGGTTGLFTAFYCGMRELTTKLIESGSELGGKVTQFLPEKLIYDIGGIPQITGDDLVKQMKDQAAKHEPTIVYNQWVETITKNDDGTFTLASTDGTRHQAKTVILATGNGKFDPAKPALDDRETFEGKSLHYTISNPQQFAGKQVMISSNNRVGLDWALTLESIAAKVYLVNNKASFQHAADEELQRLEESSVIVKLNSDVQALHGENGWLGQVSIKSENGDEQIKADHLLTYNGLKMVPAPFENWGLKTDSGRVAVDQQMNTNVEGIFAAGDATAYPGKTMLIASCYTEGLTAVNSAKKYINPKAPAQVYSTVIYRK